MKNPFVSASLSDLPVNNIRWKLQLGLILAKQQSLGPTTPFAAQQLYQTKIFTLQTYVQCSPL
jgi:hypothetical protein